MIFQEKYEDTKEKEQRTKMVHITLYWELMIDQHEHHYHQGEHRWSGNVRSSRFTTDTSHVSLIIQIYQAPENMDSPNTLALRNNVTKTRSYRYCVWLRLDVCNEIKSREQAIFSGIYILSIKRPYWSLKCLFVIRIKSI